MLIQIEKPPRLAAEIGQRIRNLRKAKGLTLLQLADRCATTPQTIQRLEVANMTMSLEWVEKFCAALDCQASDIFACDGDELAMNRLQMARMREEAEMIRVRAEQFIRHVDAFLGACSAGEDAPC